MLLWSHTPMGEAELPHQQLFCHKQQHHAESPQLLQAAAKTRELIHEGKEATDEAFARTKQTTQQVRLACYRPSRQQPRQYLVVMCETQQLQMGQPWLACGVRETQQVRLAVDCCLGV